MRVDSRLLEEERQDILELVRYDRYHVRAAIFPEDMRDVVSHCHEGTLASGEDVVGADAKPDQPVVAPPSEASPITLRGSQSVR